MCLISYYLTTTLVINGMFYLAALPNQNMHSFNFIFLLMGFCDVIALILDFNQTIFFIVVLGFICKEIC